MADTQTQNFKNHGRIVPVYHIGVFFILLANFIWSAYALTQGISGSAVMALIAMSPWLTCYQLRTMR